MDRRRFLTGLGASSSIALAGCTIGGDGGDGNGTEEGLGGTPDGSDGNATGPTNGTGADNETVTGNGTGNGAGGTAAESPEVTMETEGSDYYFDPIGLYVEPGTEITWINESGAHSSTAWAPDTPTVDDRRIPENAESWNSGTLTEGGAEFTHTVQETGTYDYYCIPHLSLGMVGRLVVGEPGGVEGSPDQGDLPDPETIVDQGTVGWQDFQG